MEKLKTYLHALQAGAQEEKLILGTMQALRLCTLQELSDHRLLVAEVYCQLLQYCQSMYKGYVPEEIIKDLLSVFENIQQIVAERTGEEEKDSNLAIVWFLRELKAHREAGDIWKMEDEILRGSVQVLLRELDNIYFVFDIKENGQYVFPIHDMIAKVVEKPDFVDINNPLGIYHIRILQLAVRLFEDIDDKRQILRTLVDRCNLKFIVYLSSVGCIIDTIDLLNYQKNGVMVFYDRTSNKVLIRHKNKGYFTGQPLKKTDEMIVEEERDHHKNTIGFFLEYKLDQGDLLTDYSEILKTQKGRETFLEFVFGGRMYNILIENSIIKKADGTLWPVNPYCYNDAVIVKGRLRSKNGRFYSKDHFIDALRRYRNAALKVDDECVMNRVSFGLALLLLQRENVGVERFRLNQLTGNDWYQSQMLQNWTRSCRDPIEALAFIVIQWQKENGYCAFPYKSRQGSIEDHEIEELDFYPVKSDNGWMYQVMGCEDPEEWYVLRGKVQEDNEGKFILAADLVSDVVGKRFSQKTGKSQFSIAIEELKDSEGLLADIWESGDEYYFLYSNKKQTGMVYNQTLLKALSILEKIQDKNRLTLETASMIGRMQYDGITTLMKLQKTALEEVGERFFCDFDSQVYYRLVHNLLWSEIDKEKIGSYIKIFMHHQKLEFSEIGDDEKFARNDINTLYVPKDRRESDSVLASIYETYLKPKSTRETNDMYKYMLNLKDDGYYYGNNRIKSIVFLCDNFTYGVATIRMLKAYLDIDDEKDGEKRKIGQMRASRQRYYIPKTYSSYPKSDLSFEQENLQEVLLKDIIERNACTIEVHGYYGTEGGKKAIEDFLKKQHIKSATVTYEKEITNCAPQIIDEVKNIWPSLNLTNNAYTYTVVREFNMTKRNVFPKEMLMNPRKAICMFVKKDEITKN